MPAHIRAVEPSDRPALSRICLLTASAGQSAEADHTIGALPGLVYAEPYAAAELLPEAATWGFVLVSEQDEVVGYVLGTSDTRAFEAALAERWWPVQQRAYPLELLQDAGAGALSEADARYIRMLHKPDTAPPAVVAYARAHMHVDILPSHQRQGWGRKLIRAAALHLKQQGHDALHLGIDPRNDDARKFYIRIGFDRLDVPGGGECYGLNIDEFLQLGKDV